MAKTVYVNRNNGMMEYWNDVKEFILVTLCAMQLTVKGDESPYFYYSLPQ